MAAKLDRKLTPASKRDIVSAISAAWKEIFNRKPTLGQIAKAFAQISAETNLGQAIYNNNVGNIIWTRNNAHDYFMNTDTRSVNGDPANRQQYTQEFRSYPTLVDGVADYLTLLKNMNGGKVLPTLLGGSTEDFSSALADAKYYDPYTKDDYVNAQGKKVPGYTSALSKHYNDFVSQYRRRHNLQNAAPASQTTNNISSTVSEFVDQLEHFVEKLVGANQKYVLFVRSNEDFSSKLEYARILKNALKIELNAKSDIMVNDDSIVLEVELPNALKDHPEVIAEVSAAISDAFRHATKKIGGMNVTGNTTQMLIIGSYSHRKLVDTINGKIFDGTSYEYELLDSEIAIENHAKFLHKFTEKNVMNNDKVSYGK
jgi:hypothetical protein